MTLCDTRVIPPQRDERRCNVHVAVRVEEEGFAQRVWEALMGR